MTTIYDDSTVLAVKEVADIVEIVGESVTLKKTGVNYKGLCPFHSEKTPSFTVNQARRSFHCFGCGEGGDVLAFVMRFHSCGFVEALKMLADRYNIALPEKVLSQKEQEAASRKKILYEVNRQATELFHHYLLHDPQAAQARSYLETRGIPSEVVCTFQLGYAPDSWDFLLKSLSFSSEELQEAGLIVPNNRGGYYDRFRHRLLCPIFSHTGQHLGFGGRTLGEQQPKYLNSPETPVYNKSSTLFGLLQAKEALRETRRGLIVEGNFDLLALVSHGMKEVVAPLGTALTREHVRALKGYVEEVVLLFDGDTAGMQAAMRSVPLFLSEKVPARVVTLPEGEDPDTFVTKYGREKLEAEIKKAGSLPEFVFGCLVDKHGLSLEGKGKIVAELQPIIEAIADRDLQRTLFVSHFSQKLGLTPEQMLPRTTQKDRLFFQEKPEPKREQAMLHLSKTEEQLLSFLIVYPEYIEAFLDAGLFDAVTHPSGQVIINHLRELAAHPDYGPEHLLNLTVGPERSFVSRQLISVPEFPDHKREAEEKMRWLQENRLRGRMKSLTARINEAQRENNQELLMELLLEKSKLNKIL